ncbi:MFS transporter [Bacillus salipaludis]|uniref:MFS transporter n=1 Tax=Bacillus salipaludis TaxID=2547811 RepID=A0A4R5VLY1_9BACI|nr:MFS transporter [Bacillus salipaludis]MDQ6598858.1 MFS transporter [Bacillus salipaludis]TDK58234.1 MFS transporter [Bacillus salipaludis]
MRMELKDNPTKITMKSKGNYRWTVVIWLLIGGVINYLDRTNLSIAAPEMIKELHLNNTDIGLMGTVFSWTYAMMQLPSGWLIDRFGAKRVFSIAVIWWSFATALTGACNKLGTLLGARFLLGVGEAPCMPSNAKITSYWYPKKERGLATGIWDSSSKWGPALAPPILVYLMTAYGWRIMFYITGLIGIIFILIFMKFYRNPEQSKVLSKEELDYIQSGGGGSAQADQSSQIKWGQLFKHRSMWGMILGFFCTIWIWNIFLNFLPLYLLKTHHVLLKDLGIYASIPWIGGIVGDILGGYMTKILTDKGIASPINAKRIMISVCAILSAVLVILVPFVQSLAITITLLTFALAFISAITGSAWALAGDIAPATMVGSVGAIQNFGGYFGGAFSPVIAGMIADSTGSYSLAFISGGIIAGCSALCYWFLVKKPIEESAG